MRLLDWRKAHNFKQPPPDSVACYGGLGHFFAHHHQRLLGIFPRQKPKQKIPPADFFPFAKEQIHLPTQKMTLRFSEH